jgi:hypothetical protein
VSANKNTLAYYEKSTIAKVKIIAKTPDLISRPINGQKISPLIVRPTGAV